MVIISVNELIEISCTVKKIDDTKDHKNKLIQTKKVTHKSQKKENDKCCQVGEHGPCGEGEGDCDSDSECSGSLVCGGDTRRLNNLKEKSSLFSRNKVKVTNWKDSLKCEVFYLKILFESRILKRFVINFGYEDTGRLYRCSKNTLSCKCNV